MSCTPAVHGVLVMAYYLHSDALAREAQEMHFFSKKKRQNDEESLGSTSSPTICGLPSLDNVARIDFCVARFDVG